MKRTILVKIILFNHQNNYEKRSNTTSNAAKNLGVLKQPI